MRFLRLFDSKRASSNCYDYIETVPLLLPSADHSYSSNCKSRFVRDGDRLHRRRLRNFLGMFAKFNSKPGLGDVKKPQAKARLFVKLGNAEASSPKIVHTSRLYFIAGA